MFAQRILVLAPHPDDEVVGAGAAIMRARAAGSEVYVAYLSDGVPAAELMWPWAVKHRPERVAVRLEEAAQVAQALGLRKVCARKIATRSLRFNLQSTLLGIRKCIHERAIETVWVPAYEGGHQDHDAANFLASYLALHTRVWEFAEYNFVGARVRTNTFVSNTDAVCELHLSTLEQAHKRELLARYRSERGNLSYVGTRVERFRPLARYDYSTPPHSGRTFYQRFQWVPWHPRIDRTKPADVCRSLMSFVHTTAQTTPAL